MPLPPSAQKIQDLLFAKGLDLKVVTFPESTHTAQEAADAIGCQVAEIAKSIALATVATNRLVIVITSGINRVSIDKVSAMVGEKVKRANADFVKENTGFAIGGVPPIGHSEPATILIDEDLMQFERIFAAAGMPNAVFGLSPAQLAELTDGLISNIKE